MAYASTYLLIASLYLLAAASPGPNFFIISQLALDGDRATALRVTAGIVIGSAVWVSAAAAGLATLLLHHASVATLLRVAGAAYLMVYGLKLLRKAARPVAALPPATRVADGSRPAGLRTGLLTSFTNPKAAAFWTSVFASTLPAAAPLGFYVGVVVLITALSACWHVGIALVFSRPALRAAYARARRVIEALSGTALLVMGLRQALAR